MFEQTVSEVQLVGALPRSKPAAKREANTLKFGIFETHGQPPEKAGRKNSKAGISWKEMATHYRRLQELLENKIKP